MKNFKCISSPFAGLLTSKRMLLLTVAVVLLCATSVLAQAPNKVYFSDDFENGTSQWVTGTGTWGLTTTDFRSGANSISSNPGGTILEAANSILVQAKAINLSGATKPILSFWDKYSFASTCCTDYDYGYVEISNDTA